jgi:hypothetical protein
VVLCVCVGVSKGAVLYFVCVSVCVRVRVGGEERFGSVLRALWGGCDGCVFACTYVVCVCVYARVMMLSEHIGGQQQPTCRSGTGV